MLSPRWRKVLRDLWHNKTRTLLVVLSIAIGVFAVGMIIHTNLLVTGEVRKDFLASNPAGATIYAENVDDEMVEVIRRLPGVADAEGRSTSTVRIRLNEEEWGGLIVRALPDLEESRIDRVVPVQVFEAAPQVLPELGVWPPQEKEFALERSSFLLGNMLPSGLRVGDTVTVETPTGKERVLRLSGLAHESTSAPATFMGQAIGYVTFDTMEWLGLNSSYDQVKITVEGDAADAAHLLAVAQAVEDKIEKSGRTVFAVDTHEPGKSPRDTILQGLTGLMFILGFLSLLLSSFLVINTVNALMSQHVRQIGMMKAIGAQNGQITTMYVVLVAMFGILALLIAVPLAALGTTQTANLLAGFLNVTFPQYTLPPAVLGIEIVMGLVLPLLAALYPIVRGTCMSVQDALSDYGVGSGSYGSGLLDRLMTKVRGLSRPTLVSLRNTFRRRGRLIMTLFTLILGGAIFIAVTNVRSSLDRTLDDALRYWQYDVSISFNRSYRLEQIESIAQNVPGVVAVESWDFAGLRRLRPDDTESDTIFVGALLADTKMLEPTLIEGRWLLPGDENALVINQEVHKNEGDIAVGDMITLLIDDRETEWKVVGVARVIGTQQWGYVNYPYFTRQAHSVGRAAQIQIVTSRHDGESVDSVVKVLEDAYEAAGVQVSSTLTTAWIREQNEFYFRIIVTLLLVMSVLIATVGALGLTGTMSINVLERTREIGVMRAIGASNRAVRNIVMTEGILIGLLSWGLGVLLAIPLGRLMSDGVGTAFFSMPLSYVASSNGIFIWLAIVVVLSLLASFLPARNASRLTVRETLAYE